MRTYAKLGMSALAVGLVCLPGLGRAQEHRDLDAQTLPNPAEALREIQNAGRAVFMMVDENHDGQISQQEAIDANNLLVGGFFFRADADGNGVVTEQEARAAIDKYLDQNPLMRYVVQTMQWQARQKNGQGSGNTAQNNLQANPIGMIMTVVDTNGDHQIQASELRQAVGTVTQSFFAAADTNRDGQMSPSEVNAAVAGVGRAVAEQAFQQADTDHNGQLSQAEYDKALVEPANTVFAILDANHDGQISQQEAQQARRVVMSQIRMLHLPEPPNSPTNLIQSGRAPSEVAPVPNFGSPNTNPGLNRAQPVQPLAPR